MKIIGVIALAAALGALLWRQGVFSTPQPAPPPPPPPAILTEPAPVISEADLAKVLKSAHDQDENVRWESVVFLDKVKSTSAMPLMRELLQHDPEPTLRVKIIELLGDRRGDEPLQALISSLQDTEPSVRIAALRSLDKIGNYSVANEIAGGPLKDPDEKVRLEALKTLNSLQDRKQHEIEAARQRYEAEKAAAAAKAAAQKN